MNLLVPELWIAAPELFLRDDVREATEWYCNDTLFLNSREVSIKIFLFQ